MADFDSLRRALALSLVGAVVFGIPTLLQPVLAPSWGAGPSQIAALLALNLAAGALGASFARVPGWIAATALGIVLASPWTSWALSSPSVLPACTLVFCASACAARWGASLLAHAPRGRHLWYAMETLGGGVALTTLLFAGFGHFDLPVLARIAGGIALIGGFLSLRLPGTGWTDSVQKTAMPPLATLALSAWSGFQFLHAQTSWTHHFAQIHANSHISFGLVALALLLGLPLGALASHRLRDLRAVALLALVGGLLLPATQGILASSFARTLGGPEIPWDVVTNSVLVLAPTAALSGLLFPWLLKRLSTPHELPALLAANLLGGMAGAATAGLVSLPLLGLHAALAVPALGWAIVATAGVPVGRSRWIAGAAAAALAVATWSLWSSPLSPRPDYEVLDRADGWSGRVEHVRRGDHEYLLYNGNYALGGTRSIRSQSWQAGFALALRPQARDVFVLGLGTGITAGTLARSEQLRRARVVELLPQVERLARRHFEPWTGPLFADPRISVEIGDARTTLRDDTARYDLVLGDLFLPWLPGAELLMGVEHFASVRDHLRPGGLFVQWLPLYQLTEPVFEEILATAQAVFGEVHLFRENHDPSAPLVALVACGPGTTLGLPESDPRVLEFRIGRTSRLAALAPLEASNHGNRLRRVTESSGIWPGQPARGDAMTDFRWTSWLDRAFRADPPATDPTLHSLGPEGMRYAVGGVLRQYAVFASLTGNQFLADSLEAQARALTSGVD